MTSLGDMSVRAVREETRASEATAAAEAAQQALEGDWASKVGEVEAEKLKEIQALVSRHDIAGIWVAFFRRCQRYRCGQGTGDYASGRHSPSTSCHASPEAPAAACLRTCVRKKRFSELSFSLAWAASRRAAASSPLVCPPPACTASPPPRTPLGTPPPSSMPCCRRRPAT